MKTMTVGATGPLVRILQERLNQHGYKLTVDGQLGALTGSAIVEAKHALGYPAGECLPQAGDRFFRLLASTSKKSLLWRARSVKRKVKPSASTLLRGKIVAWARWGVVHTAQIHYAEVRPYPQWLEPLPVTTDCSGFATLCYRHAGAPDPNGLGYLGQGYTGTLLDHAQKTGKILADLAAAKPGDLIVYGPGTGAHVAIIVEAGPDPLTVSHGQESEPGYVRVSQDGREPQRICQYL